MKNRLRYNEKSIRKFKSVKLKENYSLTDLDVDRLIQGKVLWQGVCNYDNNYSKFVKELYILHQTNN
jgi:hypothetical protein